MNTFSYIDINKDTFYTHFPMEKKKILIIGAGISGLSLAVNLKKLDIPFRIIEKQSKWNIKGLAMTIQGEGLNAASSMGILDEIKLNGTKRNLAKIYNNKGKILKQFTPNSSDNSFIVQRDTLHEALRSKISNIEMGLSAAGISKLGNRLNVIFSDGSSDSFNLVVGADGINSTTRNYINSSNLNPSKDSSVVHSGSVLWGITLNKKYSEIIEVWDKNRMCAFYPVQNKTVVSFFMKAPELFTSSRAERERHIKKYFSTISHPFVQEVLDNIPKDIFFDHVRYTRPDKWNIGRITLIGDACHSLSPLSGLGANLAMADAEGLAQIIYTYGNNANFTDKLVKYNIKRKKEADFAFNLSKQRTSRGMMIFPWTIFRNIKIKNSAKI